MTDRIETQAVQTDFQEDPQVIADRLDAARQDLLELSTRNRLLSTPRHRKRAKALEVVDERSDEMYRLLVEGKASLTFLKAADKSPEEIGQDESPEGKSAAEPHVEAGSAGELFEKEALEQPEDDGTQDVRADESGITPKRHLDLKLQTTLNSADLQKRLLRTYYDARSSELEQGVNTLYLALGFLKWYEDDTREKARYAPLVLVPVTLQRKNARTQFSIAWNEDEISTNLSLQAKLKADFGIELPDLVVESVDSEAPSASADTDGVVGEVRAFRPSDYFAQLRDLLRHVDGWEVCADDAVLSFFSFSKFLMYRDLDPAMWGGAQTLGKQPLLGALMGKQGFKPAAPVLEPGAMLDSVVGPREMVHVTLADTSQASAVEAVRRGQNVVIQGPPGTGKSQTITNLIAAAVKDGKKVLFVAEKMAALEVVQRRLSNVGLGDMCLELHSHKAKKKSVLDHLERTLALGAVTGTPTKGYFEKLTAARDAMSAHVTALHGPVGDTGVTPYVAVGELVRLRADGVAPTDFTLDDPLNWDLETAAAARATLDETLARATEMGSPAQHPWRGASAAGMTPMDLERLTGRLPDAAAALRTAATATADLGNAIEDDHRATAGAAVVWASRARRLAQAPALDTAAIAHGVWAEQATVLSALVEQVQYLGQARKQLQGQVVDAAWGADLSQTRLDLAAYGRSWFRWFNGAYRRAKGRLQAVLSGPAPSD
ncbi:MAG: DUF4011 domain-containing protein, partial [Algisphaera sp.]